MLPARTVIHAGAVFDGRNPELRRNVDIVIDRGRLQAIDPHSDDLHAGIVIDAATETVMPGLIDMHAHLESGYGEALGRIWLAYGVTSVRDPDANAFAGLEQRESYDAGRRIGPRVFLAGDPFGGIRVSEAGGVSIASESQLVQELEGFVEAGLTPFQALRAATVHAAEALGAGDQLGTIEPGKLADLVIVGGDPLQEITKARDVRGVVRGGRCYDLPALVRR